MPAALLHAQYWDGSEGGGEPQPSEPSTSTYSGWQVVVTCASAFLFFLVA